MISFYLLLFTPFINAYVRHVEHEADRFGIEITKDNYACATGFARIVNDELINPSPGILPKLWRATHPTLAERIDFCNTYKPWESGQPLKYEYLFKSK